MFFCSNILMNEMKPVVLAKDELESRDEPESSAIFGSFRFQEFDAKTKLKFLPTK